MTVKFSRYPTGPVEPIGWQHCHITVLLRMKRNGMEMAGNCSALTHTVPFHFHLHSIPLFQVVFSRFLLQLFNYWTISLRSYRCEMEWNRHYKLHLHEK